MCTGAEIAMIGVAAAGTAATVYGQQQAAQAAADAANAQGQSMADAAGRQQDAANAEAERIRAAARRQRAEAAAAYAASGVATGEGTPVLINQEITRGGEYDALNAILSGSRESKALTTDASSFGKMAGAYRQAGNTQSFGTLMSSGAQFMSASGWRSNGPGFSGTQARAPIVDLSRRG